MFLLVIPMSPSKNNKYLYTKNGSYLMSHLSLNQLHTKWLVYEQMFNFIIKLHQLRK